MNIRKIVQRRIRHSSDGVDVVGDVNAAIAANVGEPRSATHVSSSQHIVQGSRVTASSPTDDGEAEDERSS